MYKGDHKHRNEQYDEDASQEPMAIVIDPDHVSKKEYFQLLFY